MDPINIRLADRRSSVNDALRAIDRHAELGSFTRIELRYSTHALHPVAAPRAKQAICDLLREHGQTEAEVSVRRHAGAIEDASGQHRLRLHFAPRADAQDNRSPASADSPRPALAWLRRLFGARAGSAPRAASADAARAVELLREAVRLAAADVTPDDATTLAGASPARRETVVDALVIVRRVDFHTVLAPLVERDRAGIARLLADAGVPVRPHLDVRYRFDPPIDGDSTGVVLAGDVEVRLSTRPHVPPTAPARSSVPTDAHASTLCTTDGPGLDDASMTALPRLAAPHPSKAPRARLRVLGTVEGAHEREFASPFELALDVLPARLNRRALQACGFGEQHPELLAAASNRRPLHIDATSGNSDGLRVEPPKPDAAPMYFRHAGRMPLDAVELAPGERLRLIVNDPGGLVDPSTGRHLPSLMIEIEAGTNARPGE